jgi:hypothetical protein
MLSSYVSDAVNYAVNSYSLGLARTADFNGDGRVNILDVLILANHFNLRANDPGWDAKIDLNDDGRIDICDDIILAENYGK